MKAIISGIYGQDGYYLSRYLIEKGYEVHGISRRISNRVSEKNNDIVIHQADITDLSALKKIVHSVQPDEIYNLAAQSHVGLSFSNPFLTLQSNAVGVMNFLEIIKEMSNPPKFYQASTSEMFGNNMDADSYQRLTTPFSPNSPYACSKLFAHNLCNHYRDAYSLFITCGILFNHESPRRSADFVTQKIILAAKNISDGNQSVLKMGNLTPRRDWGHAKDYVRAMHDMMSAHVPKDYICATGKSYSIRAFAKKVFDLFELDFDDYYQLDPQFVRPHEVYFLRGDASKLIEETGWHPQYSFDDLVADMVSSVIDVEI